jgi:hypothetical protein
VTSPCLIVNTELNVFDGQSKKGEKKKMRKKTKPKILAAALAVLIVVAFVVTFVQVPQAKAADNWTLISNGGDVKAYPNLKEYIWQKDASMAPNGPCDKIGLRRMVNTGVSLKGVVFIMPSMFANPSNAFGSNPSTDNWVKTESESCGIYWANRGFDVYTMDTRDYFVAQQFNTNQFSFDTSQLSFMANWGWDQWISDMKEAITKTKAVSAAQKIFVVGIADGGEAVLNYATKYWSEDLSGIILQDTSLYGQKAAAVVQKQGNETNSFNLTQTLASMNSAGTWAKEFGGGAPGWMILAQYAEANPGAPPRNPYTQQWLNSTPYPANNTYTGKPVANITDWFSAIFQTVGYCNTYGGSGNLTVTMHNFATHLRYAPNRLILESTAIMNWTNCPYVTYDFDDHWSEIGCPVLAFASASYTNSTGKFKFVNSLSTTDFTGIMLPKYMAYDVFLGINSAQDVSQTTYDWMYRHIIGLQNATAQGMYRGWTVLLMDNRIYIYPPATSTKLPSVQSIGTWDSEYYGRLGWTVIDATKLYIDMFTNR